MSIPKEPRQMMINMMYLVLTALLAMNVSAEILNAFHVVNEGITKSNIAVDDKIKDIMQQFAKADHDDPGKAHDKYVNAVKAQILIDSLNKRIDRFEDAIVKGSGGWTDKNGKKQMTGWAPDKGELEDDKNLEAATRLMLEDGGAKKLKEDILDTRKKLMALLPAGDTAALSAQLSIRIDPPRKNAEGELKSWEEANFHMVPTIACMTLLNKFKEDAKSSEFQVMNSLFGKIYSASIKVDQMAAKIIAESNNVMSGEQYKADIFVAAFSTSIKPKVFIGPLTVQKKADGTYDKVLKNNPVSGGGKEYDADESGMAKYDVGAGAEGEQTYTGAVMVPDPDGTPAYYPFESKYTVTKPAAIVSSDNLNIIYAGIPNPFHVSVPGFAGDKVVASASEGSFTGGKGVYTANMPSSMVGKPVKIRVTVKTAEGNTKQIGQDQVFLVKRIPDPQANVQGKIEGTVKSGEMKVVAGVSAVLKDFYFQGVSFVVTQFDFIYTPRKMEAVFKSQKGNWRFSPEMVDLLKKAGPGDQMIIKNIHVKGPDGVDRPITSPIALTVN